MPEVPETKTDRALSERIQAYRKEAQVLVSSGAEHRCWEFKKEWSIGQNGGGKRLEFAKLIQGLANCNDDAERFVVIGASQRDKAFSPVTNSEEFDNAKVSDLLARYLEPLPVFESFNSLDTDDGKRFVIIALAQVQPRPITVKKEGHDESSKIHLRQGEVWIKRNTKLELASRSELDQMFAEKVEREAEARARQRFAHFREELIHVASPASRVSQIPTIDIILGPREAYKDYFLGLPVNEDTNRLKILLELFRESLLSSWRAVSITAKPTEIMEASFLPALDCLVESGLLIIKNELGTDALVSVCNLLQETYEFFHDGQIPQVPLAHGGLPPWQPVFQVFCGVRALAVYSMMRRRYHFLPSIQRRVVRRFMSSYGKEPQIPMVFWPFPSGMKVLPQNQGWILSLWTECIEKYWGRYFGNVQAYEMAACEYELVVELNSWVGIGKAGEAAQQAVNFWSKGILMSYISGLWLYPMRYLVPVSQQIVDSLRSGTALMEALAFVPDSMRLAFSGTLDTRLTTFGQFLKDVEAFHDETSSRNGWFPGLFEWEGALADAVKRSSATAA